MGKLWRTGLAPAILAGLAMGAWAQAAPPNSSALNPLQAPATQAAPSSGGTQGASPQSTAPQSTASPTTAPQSAAPQSTAQAGGEISGTIMSGKVPLPGVSVSATNTLTGQKSITSTDSSGAFELKVQANGRYVVRAELAAFAAITKEAVINAADRSAKVELEMQLRSRAEAAQAQQAAQAMQGQRAFGGAQQQGRGFQNVGVNAAEGADLAAAAQPPGAATGAGDASAPGIQMGAAGDPGTDSVSIAGNMGRSQNIASEMQDRLEDLRDRIQSGQIPTDGTAVSLGDGRQVAIMMPAGGGGNFAFAGGGPGGFGGGGPGMRINFNRFDSNKFHGSIFYQLGDSAFNARQYALTGVPAAKPGYEQNRYGISIGGPFQIPHLIKPMKSTFVFVNFTGNQSNNPFDVFSTVPTLAERNGDLSGLTQRNGSPLVIMNPATGQLFANNQVPVGPVAQGLLNFIPLPNLPGTSQNFHFVSTDYTSTNALNIRFVHTFGAAQRQQQRGQNGQRGGGRRGARNNLNVGLNFQRAHNDLLNPDPFIHGLVSSQGMNIPVSLSHSFGRLNNTFSVTFNRSRTQTTNSFANVTNVAGQLGIGGVSQNPFDWGLPNITLTNFSGFSDITPVLNRNQTWGFGDNLIWSHGKHTWRFGGDFRRIEQNPHTDSNARGSFVFSGAETAIIAGGQPLTGTGSDLADFLLGMPQQASAQFGSGGFYFRENSWDVYLQDEWRVRGNLSINAGLRYEYVSPFSELFNRLVNLQVSPNFTSAVPVLPGQAGFTNTLMNPDRNNFAPRLGIAWRPKKATVVRAGYGVSYNTGAYGSIVQNFAYQPPFAFTETNVAAVGAPLNIRNAFATQTSAVTNNFAADPNFVLPYVQNWNLDVQRELTHSLVMNLDYTGTKGTHLTMLRAPNRNPDGTLRISGVEPFLFETSQGDSILHAGSLRLRKRMQHGVSMGGTYVYSKSIDNASSIGGSGNTIAQNDQCLACERGLSSFDQRQRLTLDYTIDLPFGNQRLFLNQGGKLAKVFGEWQWSGSGTIASGTPFTARVINSFADVNQGLGSTLRADVTGAPISISNPSIAQWFNTAAFVAPPSGQFGNAGRNTITGPGTVTFNMAMSKNFAVRESQGLELRFQGTNVFNTPHYSGIDTTVNSPTFGRVISVGTMRNVQMLLRYRF